MTTDALDTLRNCPLFAALRPDELTSLAALGAERRLGRHEVLVNKDDPSTEMFVVLDGRLRVVSYSDGGQELDLNWIRPGQVVGELAMIDGCPRSATICADRPSVVLVFRRDHVFRLLEARPRMALEMMLVLARRVRRMTGQAEDAAFLKARTRIAKVVVTLAEDFGRATRGGGTRLDVTDTDLANRLGVTRETVNKNLGWFKSRGILHRDGGWLIVDDLGRLSAFASSDDVDA